MEHLEGRGCPRETGDRVPVLPREESAISYSVVIGHIIGCKNSKGLGGLGEIP